MNKATYKMHSRLMRIAYDNHLITNWGCLAPSLVCDEALQLLWNLRYAKTDLLAYYQKHNVTTVRRYVAN